MSTLVSNLSQWEYFQAPLAESNYIDAQDDLEAIASWLEEFKHSAHTYRAYEKESLRFLYWLRKTQGISLKLVRKSHIHTYRGFLLNPQPAEEWCAPPGERKRSRQGQTWKPFSGPLGFRSVQAALTILQGLFDYLRNAAYVPMNPFALIKQKVSDTFELSERKILLSERLLSIEDFALLVQTLSHLDCEQKKSFLWVQRTKFILYFLAYTGLRVSEFVRLQWGHFSSQQGSWWMTIQGKGGKIGKVPLNSHCMKVIQDYRQAFGLGLLTTALLENQKQLPVCFGFDTKGDAIFDHPLTERSIHAICKYIAQEAALNLDKELALKIEGFSPHWLRHFSASMQSYSGIPFEMIKAHHRHSKDETTRLYMHHDDLSRHSEAEKMNIEELIRNNG